MRFVGIEFKYSVVDSGTGRELQNRPIHNIAGLGEATGDRPFRPLAKPMLFMPRSTIRIEVEEISEGSIYEGAQLFIVLHGYKILGYGTRRMNLCHVCGIPLDAGFFDESSDHRSHRRSARSSCWPATSCIATTAACCCTSRSSPIASRAIRRSADAGLPMADPLRRAAARSLPDLRSDHQPMGPLGLPVILRLDEGCVVEFAGPANQGRSRQRCREDRRSHPRPLLVQRRVRGCTESVVESECEVR